MIAKKPSTESRAQRFIQNATTPKRELKDVIIGFDRTLLERLDPVAQSMGLTRTAFVVAAVAEKLNLISRSLQEQQAADRIAELEAELQSVTESFNMARLVMDQKSRELAGELVSKARSTLNRGKSAAA